MELSLEDFTAKVLSGPPADAATVKKASGKRQRPLTKKKLEQRRQMQAALSVTSLDAVTQIQMRGQGLAGFALDLHDKCPLLNHVELSNNALTSLASLSACSSITWLSVSHNQLDTLEGLQSLTNLKLLNVSFNQLTSLEPLAGLMQLETLLANNNKLARLPKTLSTKLATMVLSHNALEKIAVVNSLTSLAKLSVDHNQISVLPKSLGAASGPTGLLELKASHNKLTGLPKSLQSLAALRVLDLGQNQLLRKKSVNIIVALGGLLALNVAGNAALDSRHERFRTSLPLLTTLNNEKTWRNKKEQKAAEAAAAAAAAEAARPIDEVDDEAIDMGDLQKTAKAKADAKAAGEASKTEVIEIERTRASTGFQVDSFLGAAAAEVGMGGAAGWGEESEGAGPASAWGAEEPAAAPVVVVAEDEPAATAKTSTNKGKRRKKA